MQIGIRAHDCEKVPFTQLVKNIGKQGFSCTQLALKKAITDFPVDEAAMTPGMALYMKRIFAENQVDVAVLGCYRNLANPDPLMQQEILKSYEAHIRFASLLGCGVVGTETGAVNTEYKYEPANHTEEALLIFINNLRPVVECAERFGVIVAIEPVYSHIVCDVKKARKVLDEINSPNLQLIFDPVNVLSVDNYQKQDTIIEEFFRLTGTEIACLHAKDFQIQAGQLRSVAAGEGLLHYGTLMKQVKAKKPLIHLLLEDTNPLNAAAARDYVLEQYDRA